MKAAIYDSFQGPVSIRDVPDPEPSAGGVVLKVKACGICRSDWHGWMGNDPDVKPPHVPGHELAGVVAAVGSGVARWTGGESVTLPFVCGCGECGQCLSGNQQICDRQFQPGFTAWGGFAEYVAIDRADANLVRLPDEIDFASAASLGCRFATAFRGVVDQGKVVEGQWVAVHGCGGVGLSAVMIAAAFGARVVAVDIADDKLELARSIGAEAAVNGAATDVAAAVMEVTNGGAHISVDALGHPDTLFNSVSSLRKQGRHIQIGIMPAGMHNSAVPMDKIIGRELVILGSHGIQAHRYPEMLELISRGKIKLRKLIGRTITLEDAPGALMSMDNFEHVGATVIDLDLAE